MEDVLLIGLTLVVMIGVLFVSLIPFVPGPALIWFMAVVFGFLNDFERLPVLVLGGMTVLMVMGSTTDFWMPILGMRAHGASCWSVLGSFIGGLVGTFLIPIPICGMFIGAILGALLLELFTAGDLQLALNAGSSAFKSLLWGLATETSITVLLFVIFIATLYLTG